MAVDTVEGADSHWVYLVCAILGNLVELVASGILLVVFKEIIFYKVVNIDEIELLQIVDRA